MGVFSSGGMGVIGQDFPEIFGGGALLKLALFLFVCWTRQG